MPSSALRVRNLHSHQNFKLLPTNTNLVVLLSEKTAFCTSTAFKQNVGQTQNNPAAAILLVLLFAAVQMQAPGASQPG